MEAKGKCELCGEPMPPGEEMFKFHGYSGPCPKPAAVKNSKKFMDALLDKGVDAAVVGKLSSLDEPYRDAILLAVKQACYLTGQFVLQNVKEDLAKKPADPIQMVSDYQESLRQFKKDWK